MLLYVFSVEIGVASFASKNQSLSSWIIKNLKLTLKVNLVKEKKKSISIQFVNGVTFKKLSLFLCRRTFDVVC